MRHGAEASRHLRPQTPRGSSSFFSGYEKHEGDCAVTPPRALARAAGFSTEFSSLGTETACTTRSTPSDDDEHAVVLTTPCGRSAQPQPLRGSLHARCVVPRRNPRARRRGDGTHHEAVPPRPLWVYRWRHPESARERLGDCGEEVSAAFLPLARRDPARELGPKTHPVVGLDVLLPASFSLLFDDALELRVRRARHDSGARRGRATSAALAEKPLTRRRDLATRTKLTPSPFSCLAKDTPC